MNVEMRKKILAGKTRLKAEEKRLEEARDQAEALKKRLKAEAKGVFLFYHNNTSCTSLIDTLN